MSYSLINTYVLYFNSVLQGGRKVLFCSQSASICWPNVMPTILILLAQRCIPMLVQCLSAKWALVGPTYWLYVGPTLDADCMDVGPTLDICWVYVLDYKYRTYVGPLCLLHWPDVSFTLA